METEELNFKERSEILSCKKQIYIVDDDESVRRSLKIQLIAYGFRVSVFSRAEEFFNVVPNNAPGCLILDIHMPRLDGWETQKRLRRSGSSRPVIIISAEKNGDLQRHALEAGALGFLQKPFGDAELIDLINLAF